MNLGNGTRNAAIVLVLLLGVFAWKKFHPATAFAADGIDPAWDSAVETSRQSNRPAVVLFTANWCPACRALHSQTLSNMKVWSELQMKHTFITIDLSNPTRAASARASKFGVSTIPTLVRYDKSGNETARTHFLPPEQMIQWLRADD